MDQQYKEEKDLIYCSFKGLLIILMFISVGFRIDMEPKDVTVYMSWINTVALMLSIVLLMSEIYEQMKKEHKNTCREAGKKLGKNKSLMRGYIGMIIFTIVSGLISVGIILGVEKENILPIVNDVYGIISLGIAFTTDILGVFLGKGFYRYR